ncbi:L domain-like protein [Piromyces finnis]|uniref:L domain-like protein n=1 Tax=Piromyces finnis TaxID=1754191 RepID=A0A1Y1VFT4_9FUNG|nr:L domain-like protein [Piromyces finnis]|eukprot:ORX54699.1 L domain-like protein [Piromyces finnis]
MRRFTGFRDENAERNIQEKVKKQLKSLVRQGYKHGYINISNRNLSEIPDYVFNPDDVYETENIDYDFNRSVDDADWWEISELKKFNIANNKIEFISPKIGQLDTLVHLNFCDNKLTSLPQEIQNLQLVTSIHLERNNFSTIPLPLFELENLVELFLFNNKLCGDLNEYKFYKLQNLEVLDLSENFIENVGDCFSQNKKLRKLQLSHNRIKEISSLDLKHCKELELSHNELVSIFTEEQSFPMLQRLDLRNNKLQSIGNHISCPELKELYLTSNRLSSVGSILKTASHLNILDIFGNVFKEVPQDVLNMKEITRLDLGNNDITELPPRLGLLTTIKFLRFEGNMIKGIKATKTSDVLELLKNRIPANELEEDFSDPFNHKVQIRMPNNNQNQNISTDPFDGPFNNSVKPPSPKKNNNSYNLYNNQFGNTTKPPSPKKTDDYDNPFRNNQKVNQRRGYNILQSSFSNSFYDTSNQPFNNQSSYHNRNNSNQTLISADPFKNSNRPVSTSTYNSRNGFHNSNKVSSSSYDNQNQQISNHNNMNNNSTKITVSSQNTNTRTLDVSSKGLASLEMSDLESVSFAAETVDLSKNMFTRVPSSLSIYATSLTSLTINFNRITDFPDYLTLPNLAHLSMTHNLLKEFPENINSSQFPRLLELNLSYNNIKNLPSNRIPFPKLDVLILSKNKIEAIPNPEVFEQLTVLDLSDNSISFIPPKLGLCSKLQKLQLEGNTFRIPRYQILQRGTASILAYLKDRIPQN